MLNELWEVLFFFFFFFSSFAFYFMVGCAGDGWWWVVVVGFVCMVFSQTRIAVLGIQGSCVKSFSGSASEREVRIRQRL